MGRNCDSKIAITEAPAATQSRRWGQTDYRILTFLAVTGCLCLLPWLGAPGIIDSSEGYYAEGAREMLESGNFVVPHLNYEPWLEKPALVFWLMALSYKLFGVSEFAARLPSAVSAVFASMFIFVIARRFAGRRQALLSSLSLLSMPLFLVVGHLSLTDMPFALTVLLSLGGFLSALAGGSLPWLLLGYAGTALSVLLKGPLGIVLVGLVLGTYLGFVNRSLTDWRASLARLRPLLGLTIVAAIAVPWYAAVAMATHGDFVKEFFLHQNFGRAVGSVNHKSQFWLYIPCVAGGSFPWTLIAILSASALWRGFKRSPKSRQAVLYTFACLWAISMFVFFTLVPTKLATYVLPLMPAVALVSGHLLEVLLRLRRTLPVAVAAGVVIAGGIATGIALPLVFHLGAATETPIVVAMLVLAALFPSCLIAQAQARSREVIVRFTALAVLSCAVLVPMGVSFYHASHQSGFERLVGELKRTGAHFAIMGPAAHSAEFYLHSKVTVLKDVNALRRFLRDGKDQHLLLVHDGRMARVREIGCVREIDHQRKWWLVAIGGK